MEIPASIQCPYCGETFELLIDTSDGDVQFVTDCEVCCRPMDIRAGCVPGEILTLDVQQG
jgi:hypothetical protein